VKRTLLVKTPITAGEKHCQPCIFRNDYDNGRPDECYLFLIGDGADSEPRALRRDKRGRSLRCDPCLAAEKAAEKDQKEVIS